MTELVTNALTHGSQGHDRGFIPVIQLDLLLARVLVIDVWDSNPEPPVMRSAAMSAGVASPRAMDSGGLAGAGESGEPAGPDGIDSLVEGGRGLMLVSALCASWRADRIDGWDGKRVRAILPVW